LRPVRSWVRTGTRRAEDRRSRGRRHAMCEPTRRPHRALARGHSLRVLACGCREPGHIMRPARIR
jgi:hypothetical protein